MPHISTGGVSNQIVDPDFIAEPGTPVEKAIDEGLPNVNGVEDENEDADREQERDAEPDKKDGDQPKPDNDSWDPARKNEPANQTPAFEPKKSTSAKKR
jgi:hypothetical protein